jgi:hypothetical protein
VAPHRAVRPRLRGARIRAGRRFARSLVAAFLVVAALLVAALRSAVPPAPPAFGPPIAPAGVGEARLTRGTTPERARRARQWWLYSDADRRHGVGVALLEDAALLDRVFPGYGEALRTDARLLDRYFSRPFDGALTWPGGEPAAQLVLAVSWTGCLDIFEQHGADIVVFGSSETGRAVLPDGLSAALPGRPRVLACARGGMLPESVRASAEHLAALVEAGRQRRAARAVLGYSLWWAYPDATWRERGPNAGPEQRRTFEAYLASRAAEAPGAALRRLLAGAGPDAVGAPTWDAVLPTWRALRARDAAARAVRARRPIAPGGTRQGPSEAGFRFRAEDRPVLSALARASRPYYPILVGQQAAGCAGADRAAEELGAMRAALLRAADELFVYLAPVTPLQTEYAHPCLRELAATLLRGAEGARVRVRTDDWTAYGLTWDDFAVPTNDPGVLRVDVNHPNSAGAEKVTAALGRWLAGGPR